MVTSHLIVLSFLAVAASSSVPNCSTLRTTNNNEIQSNGAFSGGYNRYNDFGGGGWGGSPQTSGKLTDSCESPSANVRGKYSSSILPCAFTFHKSTVSDDAVPFSTSTVCSDDNHVNVGGGNYQIMDYVQGWGDECVGDYTRCYSLKKDEAIYLSFACGKGWTFPLGATHLSVNCTADKAAQLAALNKPTKEHNGYITDDIYINQNKEMEEQARKETHRMELFLVIGLSICMLCLVGGCVGSAYIVARHSRSNNSYSVMELEKLKLTEETPEVV